MTMNLDPRILQALLGVTPTGNSNGQYQEYTDPATGLTYSLGRNFEEVGGDAAYRTGNLLPGQIVSATGQKNNLGYNLLDVYDQQGNFLRQDDDGAGFGAFGDFVGEYMGPILAALGTWGAATGFGGALGAAEGAGVSGMDLAADAAIGSGNNIYTAGSALGGGAPAAIGGGGATQLGTSGVDAMRAGELANYATNGTLPSSAAQVGGNMGWLDWVNTAVNGTTGTRGLLDYATGNRGWLDAASTAANAANGNRRGTNWLGGLLGAAAGAASSRDSVHTQSTAPWEPAQPMLKSLLGDLDTLRVQYRDQPFSPALSTAYGNQFGLLDAANANAGGWLDGMQANASGANNYDRANPRRPPPQGAPTSFNWQPKGLLNQGWLAGLGG